MMARFCAIYPGMWRLPWEQTSDGVIPWRAFWLLYSEIPAVLTMRQVNDAGAVRAGIQMALGGDRVASEIRRELEEEGLLE
jgi:hypothetical protein